MMLIIFFLIVLQNFSVFCMDKTDKSQQWDGEYYYKNASTQEELALKVFDEIKIKAIDTPDILDIGCGPGNVDEAIVRKYPAAIITGIDNDESMIQHAKKRYKDWDELSFEKMDAQEMKFPEHKKFDIVFSNLTFHWIKDQQKVWNGIAKVLTPSGQALVCMAAQWKENPWHSFLASRQIIEPQYYPQTSDSIEKMIMNAGLKVEYAKLVPRTREFSSVDKLKSFIFSWVGGMPVMAHESNETRKQFVDDFVEYYKKYSPVKEDGSIDSLTYYLVAKAIKE